MDIHRNMFRFIIYSMAIRQLGRWRSILLVDPGDFYWYLLHPTSIQRAGEYFVVDYNYVLVHSISLETKRWLRKS